MLEWFVAGGICMYPILFISIMSLAIFLERLFFLRPKRYVPEDFINQLFHYLRSRSFEEAKILCENNRSSIANITKETLDNTNLPISRLLELTEETGRFESRKIEKYLPTLQVMANLSTMFGFLGTVLGMIKSFIALSEHGAGSIQPLAAGISEALITTATGLPVAIMTIIFYYIIKYQSEKIIYLMEKNTSNIINYIFKGE